MIDHDKARHTATMIIMGLGGSSEEVAAAYLDLVTDNGEPVTAEQWADFRRLLDSVEPPKGITASMLRWARALFGC